MENTFQVREATTERSQQVTCPLDLEKSTMILTEFCPEISFPGTSDRGDCWAQSFVEILVFASPTSYMLHPPIFLH